MNDYFNSPAIGSSLLGTCIVSVDPLTICTDRATKEIKPTSFMEMGKIFEDLAQSEYDARFDFWEKYFKSDMASIPEYKGERTDIKQILEILEELDNWDLDATRVMKQSYIYKSDSSLHGSYKSRHRMLDQIRAHDYRRPIPAPWWDKLEVMLERFGNCPVELYGYRRTIDEWMRSGEALFQVEYFWEDSGAKCRAKYDLILLVEFGYDKYAIPFDLKCTGDGVDDNASFGAFARNWKTKYVWQSKHYHEGFLLWCREHGYEPYEQILYVVQESESPQITNVWTLHTEELRMLSEPYREALAIIQAWIDEEKPVRGFMPQRTVNRYGREWR